MTADIRNALALQVASELEYRATASHCMADSAVYRDEAAAIRELVELQTETCEQDDAAEITPKTSRLAEEGAQRITNEADAYQADNCPKVAAILRAEAAAIRSLIAHATETCEWAEDEYDGSWNISCGAKFVLTTSYGPTKHGFKFCPYCGKRLIEKPFALTETKRDGKLT